MLNVFWSQLETVDPAAPQSEPITELEPPLEPASDDETDESETAEDETPATKTLKPSQQKQMEAELRARLQKLYPQKGLNAPLQQLCKNNPKHKQLLNAEQAQFYCLLHTEFRACYTRDVLYNFAINREQKVRMAKDCIRQTSAQQERFANNPDQAQDYENMDGFTESFLQLMLPEPAQPEPISPSAQPFPEDREVFGRIRRGDRSDYALNNSLTETRHLDDVDQALDTVNEHVLQLKREAADVPRQYPQAISHEILLLDTLPQERNNQGQTITYEFNREHCLVRPMSALDCEALINENVRRRQAKERYKQPVNPDRYLYRKNEIEQ